MRGNHPQLANSFRAKESGRNAGLEWASAAEATR